MDIKEKRELVNTLFDLADIKTTVRAGVSHSEVELNITDKETGEWLFTAFDTLKPEDILRMLATSLPQPVDKLRLTLGETVIVKKSVFYEKAKLFGVWLNNIMNLEQKLKELLELYKNDYSGFVDLYKKDLEPKLLFIAESQSIPFVGSSNPELGFDIELSPPSLLVTDDLGNKLSFSVQVLTSSLEEVMANYNLIRK